MKQAVPGPSPPCLLRGFIAWEPCAFLLCPCRLPSNFLVHSQEEERNSNPAMSNSPDWLVARAWVGGKWGGRTRGPGCLEAILVNVRRFSEQGTKR